ncbi:hypothetical protein KSC_044870 [Ktedonobacter sp. SOSP1-52]|nr:hypothetical protein KSC_044870 [Ktedonobacter sp. SOSP1-52]
MGETDPGRSEEAAVIVALMWEGEKSASSLLPMCISESCIRGEAQKALASPLVSLLPRGLVFGNYTVV